MNVLVFDIETIPDVVGGKKIYNLDENLSNTETAEALFEIRRKENGTEFLKHHLHQVVAISCVYRNTHTDQLHVWSLGDEQADEKTIIQKFFDGIEQKQPTIVSWNGAGFDLPVLHYRAMLNSVVAERYWEQGVNEQSYKWNNYISRYHERHTDLMDLIAMFTGRANAPLDQMATLLGFPGKMGMSGDKVWQTYIEGSIKAIRNYCETDVLNTFLVYLRFQLMRGNLLPTQYDTEIKRLKAWLREQESEHFKEFLAIWESA